MALKTSVGFELRGLKVALLQLEKIADRKQTDSRIGSAMRNAAKPILAAAKSKVPVGKGKMGGTLKRSLTISSKKIRGNRTVRVGPDSTFAEVSLETASSATSGGAIILGKTEKRPSRYAHLVEFGTSKTNPRPFMVPAGEQEGGDKYIKRVAKAVGKSIERLIKKGLKSA